MKLIRALALFGSGMASRKLIKVAAIIAFLYCTLLVYQGGVSNFQEPRVQVQELTIVPVTKSSVNDSDTSKNITLDDLFISVKTTKHYENTRLPIILKTWFQLAKKPDMVFHRRRKPSSSKPNKRPHGEHEMLCISLQKCTLLQNGGRIRPLLRK